MSVFFSFDGIDGGGKSTQLKLFCQWLTDQGRDPVVCRDPGSTAAGEQIREILLLASDDSTPIAPRSEMLLYMAARRSAGRRNHSACPGGRPDRGFRPLSARQHRLPGLRRRACRWRSCGRSAPSRSMASRPTAPSCSISIQPSPWPGWGGNSIASKIEATAYRERLRAGFLAEAAASGGRSTSIAADRQVDAIQDEIRSIATKLFASR